MGSVKYIELPRERTLRSRGYSTIAQPPPTFARQKLSFLFLLDSVDPHAFVVRDLRGSKSHSRDDIGDIGEKWVSEDAHEAYLPIC